MGFGGAVAAMVASIKRNKRERKTKPFSNAHAIKTGLSISSRKATEEELLQIRTRLELEQKNSRKKQIAVFIILSFFAFWVYWYLSHLHFKN